jgi:hypothetical protein
MDFRLYTPVDPSDGLLVETVCTVGELMQAAVAHYGPGPWLVYMGKKKIELGEDARSVFEIPEFNLPDITDIRLVLKRPPPPPSSSIAAVPPPPSSSIAAVPPPPSSSIAAVPPPSPPELGEVHAQVSSPSPSPSPSPTQRPM